MFKAIRVCIYFICLAWTELVVSSPWIGTLEPQLHQDLQTLTEWQVLDASVTSYPVPWKGVAKQLERAKENELPEVALIALKRLKHYLNAHKKQQGQSVISLYGASGDSRFTNFSGVESQNVQLNITKEVYLGRWAAQLSANHEGGGQTHFDESFIAYQFGDWNFRLGAISQFWGPAQSSSLILSNNARPVPSVSFSRSRATRSEGKWLKHLGPWFFTAQIGQLEGQRAVPDTKLWMTRFNFKPISQLEIGLSWSAMWGGTGQGNSLKDFLNVITFRAECANGEASCDEALETKRGNHLAGFDFKYSTMLFGRPLSIYGQRIGEDAIDYYRVTDNANLIGLSSYIGGNKVYIEASDTNVACSNTGSQEKNCYYEHDTYQSGYRRYGRAIGSTFDSDAKMLSVGLNRHFSNGDIVDLAINHLTLNEDNELPPPVLQDNVSEELVRLSGFYQTQYGDWLIKLGANIEHADVNNITSETDGLVYTEIKYRLD